MYSALKVNGKKLYELASAGKEVERAARPVEIYDLQIDAVELPRVTMTVTCSKGTYIRTLCHDIGRKAGMRRLHGITFCGPAWIGFELADSLTLIPDRGSSAIAGESGGPCGSRWKSVFAGTSGPCTAEPGDGDKLVHNGNPFPSGACDSL